MKNNLHLSFKRWKPRLNSINMQKLKLWRILFCIKFVRSLDKETLIANVDESTISRHSQLFYSRSQKGKPQEFKNIPFTGSINLILTILSNGAWFCLLTNQTMGSEGFLSYMQSFKEWMSDNDYFGYKKLIVTMDNCAIHRSKRSLAEIGNMFNEIMYIPVYSPQLAPVEMWFSFIKHNLKTKMKFQVWNLNNKNRREWVFESMKSLTSKLVRSYFTKFYTEIRQHLTL